MACDIRIAPKAQRVIKRLDPILRQRLSQVLSALSEDPFAVAKPLQASELWAARVGDWRLILSIDVAARILSIDVAARMIEVDAIRPRGQAYRRLS